MLIVIIFVSCGEAQVDTKAEGEKIMQISRDWSKSAATDSIDKMLSYWADDAIVMSPGEAPIKGKKAIREMVEGASRFQVLKLVGNP